MRPPIVFYGDLHVLSPLPVPMRLAASLVVCALLALLGEGFLIGVSAAHAQHPVPSSTDTLNGASPSSPPLTPLPDPALRDSLLSMDAASRSVRRQIPALLQADSVDGAAYTRIHRRLDSVHVAHERRLSVMFDARGFPSAARVGPDAVQAAYRLVQQSDSALQARALPFVERAYHRGDLDGDAVASLTDRVRGNAGRPQLYGTQGMIVNGRFILRPIEDSARVDARRDSLGLPPLHVYLDELRAYYGVQ